MHTPRPHRLSRGLIAPAACVAAALLASPARGQQIGDVFYIDMENHNLTQPSSVTSPAQLLNNPAAPFLNSLMTPGNPNAAQTSWASNYTNVAAGVHPSEPNYVWQEAGLHGPLNDADPFPNNIVNAPHLTGLLQTSGISWKAYQEDAQVHRRLPGQRRPARPATSGNRQHASPTPTTAATSTTSPPNTTGHSSSPTPTAEHVAASNQPLRAVVAALHRPCQQHGRRYNLITPDQYNDMHSALTGGFTYNGVHYTGDQSAIAAGDNFLSIIIPQIMASQAYKNNGAIVIWFDETENGDSSQFTVPEIVISPLAVGNGFQVTTPLTHSSDLKTLEELFGVYAPGGGFLGDANTPGTNDLSGFFQANAAARAVVAGATRPRRMLRPVQVGPRPSPGLSDADRGELGASARSLGGPACFEAASCGPR